MLVIERLGSGQVLFVKEPGVFLAEEATTKLMTCEIANIIPHNGTDKSADYEKLDVKEVLRCQNACCEQQAVSWQKKANQQA